MGWAIIFILALLVFTALWPFIGKDKGAVQFLGVQTLTTGGAS